MNQTHKKNFSTVLQSVKKASGEIMLHMAVCCPTFNCITFLYVILLEKYNMLFFFYSSYIYGKHIRMTSLISAWKYFSIGDKYLVPKIQDTAKQYIKSISLTDDTFWDIIENNLFSNSHFLDKVKFYLMENTSKIITTEKFLSVPEDIVHILLQMDKLNVREYDLLIAVTKWGYKNIDHVNSKDLIKFYEHIRFSTISSDEFFQFVDSYPEAIDAQSSLKILQHLRNVSSHNLPTWCSTSKVSRYNVLHKQPDRIRCLKYPYH